MHDQVGIPLMTEGQIRQAVTVIPVKYWNLTCSTYLQDGHSTIICPYLAAEQHLYFSYSYYLFHIYANPQLVKYI